MGMANKAEVTGVGHIPLAEVSALAFHITGPGKGVVAAIGDRKGVLAFTSVERKQNSWRIRDRRWLAVPIQGVLGTERQWEGAAIDGIGRIVLLREAPPQLAVIDDTGDVLSSDIGLTLPEGHSLEEAWTDPASGPEGLVLLDGGHVLVVKEKDPPAIIEFAASTEVWPHANRGQWLSQGVAWDVPAGDLVAVATWFLDAEASATLGDISDAAVGPDGSMYVLSDRSATIMRIEMGPLDMTRVGVASGHQTWRLGDEYENPEGIAILPDHSALVAMDRKHARKNLLVLDRLVQTL